MASLSNVEISGIDGEVVASGIVDVKPVEISKIVGTGSIVFRDIFRGFFRRQAQSLGDALNPLVQRSYKPYVKGVFALFEYDLTPAAEEDDPWLAGQVSQDFLCRPQVLIFSKKDLRFYI